MSSDEENQNPRQQCDYSDDESEGLPGAKAGLVKRSWTPEEDAALVAAVDKYGACRWSIIATHLSTGRVGKQCRERWNNHLCPEVKKSDFSDEDDRAILIGVAELGMIAGVGMFIGVASSFTILPAILAGAEGTPRASSAIPPLRLPTWPTRHAGIVVGACCLLAAAGMTRLPDLFFDPNPLNVRDPGAESVRVYEDLLAERARSPWTLEYLAGSAREANAISSRFEALSEVDAARTLSDFVPAAQAPKLEAIEEMAYFVDWSTLVPRPPPSPEASFASLERLRAALAPLGDGVERLDDGKATLRVTKGGAPLVDITRAPVKSHARMRNKLERSLRG